MVLWTEALKTPAHPDLIAPSSCQINSETKALLEATMHAVQGTLATRSKVTIARSGLRLTAGPACVNRCPLWFEAAAFEDAKRNLEAALQAYIECMMCENGNGLTRSA